MKSNTVCVRQEKLRGIVIYLGEENYSLPIVSVPLITTGVESLGNDFDVPIDVATRRDISLGNMVAHRAQRLQLGDVNRGKQRKP